MTHSQYLIPLLMFIVFAAPMTFKSVRGILGGWVANPEGQAKFLGLLVHGILFVITVGYLMRRVSPYGWSSFVPTTQSRSNQIDKMMEMSGESGPDMGPNPTRPNLKMGYI
jgi:hypothetical protein